MKKNWTKYLSVLLTVLMLVGMLSVGVSAATAPQQDGTTAQLPSATWPNGSPNGNYWVGMNPSPDNDYEEEEDNGKIDIVVRKKWVGDNESIRPSEVTIQLIENGDPIGKPVTIKESKVSDKNWKYTWENMDEDSEYTIVEINTPEGYVSTVENLRGNYWVITNTYNPAPASSSAPASKTNPETGASEIGGMSVAVAVCVAAISAVGISKKF